MTINEINILNDVRSPYRTLIYVSTYLDIRSQTITSFSQQEKYPKKLNPQFIIQQSIHSKFFQF